MGTQLQKELLLSQKTDSVPADTGEFFQPPVNGDAVDLRHFSGLNGHKQFCIQNLNLIKYNKNKTVEIIRWISELFMFREVTYSPISSAQLKIFVQTFLPVLEILCLFLGI